MICATTSLAYSKDHVFALRLTCVLYVVIMLSIVRRSSHRGGSPQNRLRDERTCGTTLASAYVLRRPSAMWLQLQMKERKSKWE